MPVYNADDKLYTGYIITGSKLDASIGEYSTAEGYRNIASGENAHAEGYETQAIGTCSHAEGSCTEAIGIYAHAGGFSTQASGYQYAIGRNNKSSNGPTGTNDKTGSLFIVGNGTQSPYAETNCFRIETTGQVYATGTFHSSGADYAELFEWEDGNINNEDRVGRFVSLSGNKIHISEKVDSNVWGVISATAAVIGDQYADQWKGMYKLDSFGRPIVEKVVIPAHTDEDSGKEIAEYSSHQWVLNPDFDENATFVPRLERTEWDAVGTLGKLVVIDDGTCLINHYCTIAENGTGTATDNYTRGYRVLERIDSTHVRVWVHGPLYFD